jgi:hypothetical protein
MDSGRTGESLDGSGAGAVIFAHMKRIAQILISVLAILLLLFYVAFFWPLPGERVIKVETSPDGKLEATYSWKHSGFCGAYTGNGAWVYLTVRDSTSKEVIGRFTTHADVPDEAERRLASQRPW